MKRQKTLSPTNSRRLFFSGVVLLGGANLLVKVIGLLFKIPMSYYLGDEGMGYFNSAYQIYTWLYMLSTAGLPVAVSILIAESRARGQRARVSRIERITTLTFLVLGLLGTALMAFGAPALAALIGTPAAAEAIVAMAPTMLFICLASALRGYFQGFGRMGSPAGSQVLEALGKLLVGVFLASYAVRQGAPLPTVAAYAVTGLAIGEALSFFYLLLCRLLARRQGAYLITPLPDTPEEREGGRALLGRLLKIALPITASASVMSLTGFLDLLLVQRRLQSIGYSVVEATAFYGNYTTLVVPMFNLPPALVYPITTAALPLLTGTVARGRGEALARHARTLMRVTALIAAPCALGLSVFARPILLIFFPPAMVESAAPLLSVLAPAVFFLSLLSVTNVILQATGHAARPMLSMLLGAAAKIGAAYLLIGLPAVGGTGVPVGTLLCYLVALGANLVFLMRDEGITPSLSRTFFRPAIAAAFSVGGALGFYLLLGGETGGHAATLASILMAAAIYLAAIFLTRTVTDEDLALIPGIEKIRRIFTKNKQKLINSSQHSQ